MLRKEANSLVRSNVSNMPKAAVRQFLYVGRSAQNRAGIEHASSALTGHLHTEFSDKACAVASIPESRRIACRSSSRTERRRAESVTVGTLPPSCQETRSAGSTDRCGDKGPLKTYPTSSQRIHRGSSQYRMALDTRLSHRLVIGQEKEKMRARTLRRHIGKDEKKTQYDAPETGRSNPGAQHSIIPGPGSPGRSFRQGLVLQAGRRSRLNS